MDKLDFIAIKDIRGSMKNINVMFIVLEVVATTKTKENREVYSFKVADQTACINCSIWDEPGKLLQPGDIVRMMKCYSQIWRGCLTLYSGKSGEIIRVGDFCMIFNEQLNMSDPLPLLLNTAQPTIPTVNNGTNGNGRSQIGNSLTPQISAQSLPSVALANNSSTSSTGDNIKPKVTNSNARSYMDYDKLICNYKDCYKILKETAYITFCSHIFCNDHGQKLKSCLSNGCFACKGTLMDHQILHTNLNVSGDTKKLLLCGLSPKVILEVASSALGFWSHQKKHENLDLKRQLDHYRMKLQTQTKQLDEKDSRIFNLLKDIERIESENRFLKADLASKTECIQKDLEKQKTKRSRVDDQFEI
ncbi:CLUMA_CG013548, isoform A [Clunio marinus]|uniref:CLUMA_CG013548, isoform A n=1 Tax=Clunio marinus TaxID=568069 RepID=A0A1J1IJ73_9DIPT|nr:CLUMA_CG013548, isoform A [Clunio marinus]